MHKIRNIKPCILTQRIKVPSLAVGSIWQTNHAMSIERQCSTIAGHEHQTLENGPSLQATDNL